MQTSLLTYIIKETKEKLLYDLLLLIIILLG